CFNFIMARSYCALFNCRDARATFPNYISTLFLDTLNIFVVTRVPDFLRYGTPYMNRAEAESLLRQMLGADKSFRAGQWEAIEMAAVRKQRVLVVQRTGWGKSIVYFIANKILRDGGSGPALLISPLLALMRNQIEAARNS